MSRAQEEALKRFATDAATAEAVHAFLYTSFVKPRDPHTSVYPSTEFLAAERIAADLFEAAWTALLQFKQPDAEPKITTQVGM